MCNFVIAVLDRSLLCRPAGLIFRDLPVLEQRCLLSYLATIRNFYSLEVINTIKTTLKMKLALIFIGWLSELDCIVLFWCLETGSYPVVQAGTVSNLSLPKFWSYRDGRPHLALNHMALRAILSAVHTHLYACKTLAIPRGTFKILLSSWVNVFLFLFIFVFLRQGLSL